MVPFLVRSALPKETYELVHCQSGAAASLFPKMKASAVDRFLQTAINTWSC